jgi:hypothetical protein
MDGSSTFAARKKQIFPTLRLTFIFCQEGAFLL